MTELTINLDLTLEEISALLEENIRVVRHIQEHGFEKDTNKEQREAYSREIWRRRLRSKHIADKLRYSDYLSTQYWDFRREETHDRAKYKCQLCGEEMKEDTQQSFDVHHNTYDRKGCEDPEDLILLCRECHSTFHAWKNGDKPDGQPAATQEISQ